MASSISRVVVALEVAVTATNLTKSSESLCADDGFAGPLASVKGDNRLAMFCFPGKYFTLNLLQSQDPHSIHAHGFDLRE